MQQKKHPAPRRPRITLRAITPDAIASIYPLVHLNNPTLTRAAFNARLKDMLPFGYRAVAAFEGDRMVGVSGFWLRARFWCGRQMDIDNLVVHPDYRGQQIGKKLIQWIEKRALAEKCDLIVLDAYAQSTLTHRFYHREGFIITGYHFTKVPGSATPWAAPTT